MEDDYSFEKAETRYKIETADKRELELMLNASRMSLALYDILNWSKSIFNGKNYGEGCVLYKGKLYTKNEWEKVEHTEDEYEEGTPFLKEKVKYLYTEDELLHKLEELTDDVCDIINRYYNY